MTTIPKSAQELFDQQIPAALLEHADKAKQIGAVYLFKVSGDGGGDWTVDLSATPPTCSRGEGAKPGCTIEIAHDDFKQVLANPAVAMQMYFQGKLRVTGDPMLATKLSKLFSLGA